MQAVEIETIVILSAAAAPIRQRTGGLCKVMRSQASRTVSCFRFSKPGGKAKIRCSRSEERALMLRTVDPELEFDRGSQHEV